MKSLTGPDGMDLFPSEQPLDNLRSYGWLATPKTTHYLLFTYPDDSYHTSYQADWSAYYSHYPGT